MVKRIILALIIIEIFININIKVANASEILNIRGKDRYETAAFIAKQINYDKAIIVNGTALVDGLSASGLSGAVNAPILLTTLDVLPQVTLDALKAVNTVYIVGGTGVISQKVENELKAIGITSIRIGGKDRYATSLAVANEITRLKAINEIYYVNGIIGEADAMSIAPVATKNGNPVILTDGASTSYKVNDITAYAIGGIGVMNSSFDRFCIRLGGENRFETNKLVINEFFTERSEVYLSKSEELIDALTSSALKKPVVLVDENSDKSILAGTKKITALGDVNKVALARANSYLYGDKVFFYTQHQDDETLFTGSTIIDAVKSVGADNVYLVLFTKGNNSGVFDGKRYINLSDNERAQLRNNELKAATDRLGIKQCNIIYLNQNEYSVDYRTLHNLIEDVENKFTSVTHITHSYKYDIHPEHMQTGQVFYDLYNAGKIKDVRFFARSTEGDKIPIDYLIEGVSDTEEERQKVVDACNEYKLDRCDFEREGIGYKSVGAMFEALIKSKTNSSYLHKPGA